MSKDFFNLFKNRRGEDNILNDKPKAVEFKYLVGICIPNSKEFISTQTAFSLLAISCPTAVGRMLTTRDAEPVNRCRNIMISEFLTQNPHMSHILMIEPYVRVNTGTLWELFSIDADIISVPIFDGQAPHHPNIYKSESELHTTFDQCDQGVTSTEIYSTDPGCILFRRKLFDDVDVKNFYFDDSRPDKSDIFLFCERAKKKNYVVKATTKLCQSRMAHQEITYKYFKEFRDYEERKKQSQNFS